MHTITETLTLNVIHCASCHVSFAMPDHWEDHFRKTHETFYCPAGHRNYYSGNNESEKLRNELKRKEQELADQVQQRFAVQHKLEYAEKKLKRIHKGVCPCCNRTFTNVARHMKTKHPEVI